MIRFEPLFEETVPIVVGRYSEVEELLATFCRESEISPRGAAILHDRYVLGLTVNEISYKYSLKCSTVRTLTCEALTAIRNAVLSGGASCPAIRQSA